LAVKDRICPRWGYVNLTTKSGSTYTVKTICKTWGCPVCRFKRASYVKAMMERGILMGGFFYLITLTLRAEERDKHLADFVSVAWTRLLRLLKRSYPELMWFRVVEATKKGTPHLHVIMGGMGKRRDGKSTHGRYPPYSEAFIRDRSCVCLLHEVGFIWWEATNAFVVDVEQIYNPAGAVRYLAKYLVKGFLDRQSLEDLGYSRRYSMSRNWPRGEALRLRGSSEDRWEKIEIIPGWYRNDVQERLEALSRGARLLESVGDDLTLEIAGRRRLKASITKIEKMKRATENPE